MGGRKKNSTKEISPLGGKQIPISGAFSNMSKLLSFIEYKLTLTLALCCGFFSLFLYCATNPGTIEAAPHKKKAQAKNQKHHLGLPQGLQGGPKIQMQALRRSAAAFLTDLDGKWHPHGMLASLQVALPTTPQLLSLLCP